MAYGAKFSKGKTSPRKPKLEPDQQVRSRAVPGSERLVVSNRLIVSKTNKCVTAGQTFSSRLARIASRNQIVSHKTKLRKSLATETSPEPEEDWPAAVVLSEADYQAFLEELDRDDDPPEALVELLNLTR